MSAMKGLIVISFVLMIATAAQAFRIAPNHIQGTEEGFPPEFGSYKDDDTKSAEFSEEDLNHFLISAEHAALRRTLKAIIRLLDEQDNYLNDRAIPSDPEMPHYLEYIAAILNGDISRQEKRSHRKRNSFDSISHQSGLGGGLGDSSAGGAGQRRKSFSFNALFPYLLKELRRSTRGGTSNS